MMKVKLSEEDRCAIDLVLEQRAAAAAGGLEHCFGKSSASLQKRVAQVGKLFDLLGHLPAEEPPANLVAATMKYVQRHEHEVIGQAAAPRRAVVVHHPAATAQ